MMNLIANFFQINFDDGIFLQIGEYHPYYRIDRC